MNRLPRFFAVALLVAAGVAPGALAQDAGMTLKDAIRSGLDANRRTVIAELEREKAENSASPGAAGFLPSLDAYAGFGGSLTSTDQTYLNGETVSQTGASSRTFQTGVDLNWNLFNGFGSVAERDRLEGEKKRAMLSERLERESLTLEIADAYVQVVRLERLRQVEEEAIQLSLARRDLAQARLETGEGIRFELTTAQVDLDADSAALLRRDLQLSDSRIHLNRLLNRSPLSELLLSGSMEIGVEMPSLEELNRKMTLQNSSVQATVIEQEIAEASRRVAASDRYPDLTLNLGYDFTNAEAGAGFVTSNQSSGFNYNLTASLNIFNGFVTKQRIENAELDIRRSELRHAESLTEAESLLARIYEQYRRQEQLVAFERTRIEGARENLQLAQDRLELGAVTPVEVRQAQTGFIEAGSRLTEAEYEKAVLGLSLLQLSGDILQLAE